MSRRFGRVGPVVATVVLALAVGGCTSGSSSSAVKQSGTTTAGGSNHSGNITYEQMVQYANQAVQGKTLAFVPNGLGQPLTLEWANRLKEGAEHYGFTFKMVDPNWDATRQAQADQSFVNELNPGDVLVVHNFNVQLLAKILQQAEAKGIYVLQIGQESN